MSVMCPFLLTNSVGLKGKELNFLENWQFFLSTGTIFFLITLVQVLIIRTFCAVYYTYSITESLRYIAASIYCFDSLNHFAVSCAYSHNNNEKETYASVCGAVARRSRDIGWRSCESSADCQTTFFRRFKHFEQILKKSLNGQATVVEGHATVGRLSNNPF